MDDIKAMKAKIAKLLAMANGTDNENEAAVFMSKAESLMDEWQLSHWEITSHDDPMGEEVMLEGTSSSPTWQRHLLCAIADYYGCKTVRTRGLAKQTNKGMVYDGFKINVIGRESSRVTTELMYPFVIAQLREAGRKLHAQGHYGSVEALTRRVANALVFRIYKLIEQRKAANDPVATRHDAMRNERALVVVNELKAFIEGAYPHLKTGIARQRSVTGAATRAAEGISIERQVKGAGQLRLGKA